MDRDDKTPENEPKPTATRKAPAEDVVEIVTVEDDGAAKHRVWAKVAGLAVVVLALLFVFVKSCAVGEKGIDAVSDAVRNVSAGAATAYADMKRAAGSIWGEISSKGDTNYSYSIVFKSAKALDKYVIASNKDVVTERIGRKKWFSTAEAVLSGNATFEYYIALAKGMRIEATQTQDGRPIVYCIFSDLKLDTPVKFELRHVENVKNGFLIDEQDMVNAYQINRLQKDLAREGNSSIKLAFAREKAAESLRAHFLKAWLPDVPWDQARVFIAFDSEKLEAPAGRTFTLSLPVAPEGRPLEGAQP